MILTFESKAEYENFRAIKTDFKKKIWLGNVKHSSFLEWDYDTPRFINDESRSYECYSFNATTINPTDCKEQLPFVCKKSTVKQDEKIWVGRRKIKQLVHQSPDPQELRKPITPSNLKSCPAVVGEELLRRKCSKTYDVYFEEYMGKDKCPPYTMKYGEYCYFAIFSLAIFSKMPKRKPKNLESLVRLYQAKVKKFSRVEKFWVSELQTDEWERVKIFYYGSLVRYETAVQICANEGGFLASFVDEKEERVLEKLAVTRYFWLGLSQNDNTWEWHDGLNGDYIEKQIENNRFHTMRGNEENTRVFADRETMAWYETGSDQDEFSVLCKFHEVDQNKCPTYFSLQDYFLQPPESVSVNDGERHYCLYDFKLSKEMFGETEVINETVTFETAENFCIDKMNSEFLRPESADEFVFLHQSRICYPSWEKGDSTCYRIYSTYKNKTSAEKICESMANGYLAFKELTRDQTSVKEYIRDDCYYVGIYKDPYQKLKWIFPDGTEVPQSVMSSQRANYDCACIKATDTIKYFHSKCDGMRPFICEYKSRFYAQNYHLTLIILHNSFHRLGDRTH
ncbi:unnamed protein product [Enterobius vermicularis]|uniref:C-type lectin domain-containing protein n=1 Tax=Enterobius vermicularis TaxID=51028 RepID=A0A0N4V3V4_ENTVE|nr:unnamed protein product [Enterobius vermicularis]